MLTRPAHEIAAGSFVKATVADRPTLCLKVERVGKEHTNHFLVPVEPVGDRRALALVYIDPNEPLAPVDGVSFVLADGPAETPPEVGDTFLNSSGVMLKVIDDPHSQRLWAYVDIASGQVRPRMERHIQRLVAWSIQRI